MEVIEMERKSLKEWKKIFEKGEKENLLFIVKDLSSMYVKDLSRDDSWQKRDKVQFEIDTLKYVAKRKLLEKYGVDLDREKAMEILKRIRRAVEKEDMTWISDIESLIEKEKEYISPKAPLFFPSSPVLGGEMALYAEKVSEAQKRKLSDLGTSEEELEELKKKSAKIEAKYWLKFAREGKNDDVLDYIQWAREYLVKAGIKPEEIGTSEKELIELEKKGYKYKAKYWLDRTREFSKKEDVEDKIRFLRDYLAKAELKLEDIGTSEEELESLKKEGYGVEAEYCLKTARVKYAKKEELRKLESAVVQKYKN